MLSWFACLYECCFVLSCACVFLPFLSCACLSSPCSALRASYLSHTHVLLLLLLPFLLSFPSFPTPFSSGMVPNGTTLAG